jgi:hypothetical protein
VSVSADMKMVGHHGCGLSSIRIGPGRQRISPSTTRIKRRTSNLGNVPIMALPCWIPQRLSAVVIVAGQKDPILAQHSDSILMRRRETVDGSIAL